MNARHEAPSTGWDERAQRRAVAAELRKLGAVSPRRHEAGREAAPTTTGRAGTARRPGSGKQGGKAYERNQCFKLLKLFADLKPGGHGSVPQRTSRLGGTRKPVCSSRPGGHGEVCGVPVARLQEHSWAPTPPTGCMVNVGTPRGLPSPTVVQTGGGQAGRRLLAPGEDGALVVVRGRESRPHGEGGQQACTADAETPGGRR
jgi:hypothetical protein